MGFCKYLEDNYEMFLERIEGQNDYDNVANISTSNETAANVKVIEITNPIIRSEKIIRCKDCGDLFILSINEQNFFKKRNLCNPKRCKSCRSIRKKMAG